MTERNRVSFTPRPAGAALGRPASVHSPWWLSRLVHLLGAWLLGRVVPSVAVTLGLLKCFRGLHGWYARRLGCRRCAGGLALATAALVGFFPLLGLTQQLLDSSREWFGRGRQALRILMVGKGLLRRSAPADEPSLAGLPTLGAACVVLGFVAVDPWELRAPPEEEPAPASLQSGLGQVVDVLENGTTLGLFAVVLTLAVAALLPWLPLRFTNRRCRPATAGRVAPRARRAAQAPGVLVVDVATPKL